MSNSGAIPADKPSVAICIPTYNQEPYLELAVRSACAQTYDGPLEIWVSDDASTDGTPQRMQELCAELPQIRYHRQAKNGGISVNNSWLMRQPETDYLVRLDSDDLLAPEYVVTVVTALEAAPEAGYAHTAVQNIDEKGMPLQVRRIARPTGYQDAESALRASLSGYRTAANILTFRTAALRALNYYSQEIQSAEDYDLSVRMADAGYGNVYVDEVLASYRVWNDAQNKRARRKRAQLIGYLHLFDKSMTPAFARRGWDIAAVRRQRQKLAALNVTSCCSPLYSAEEREDLTRLLLALGDGPAVRTRLALCRLGLGAAVDGMDRSKFLAKDIAKAMLRQVRRLRTGNTDTKAAGQNTVAAQ